MKKDFKDALIENDESQSDILRGHIKQYIEKTKRNKTPNNTEGKLFI